MFLQQRGVKPHIFFGFNQCGDFILAEQLRDRPETLPELVMFMARRAAGSEAGVLSEEVMAWMGRELPAEYAWPGNYRELEQCVRNILIRRSYRPLVTARSGEEDDFYRRMKRGEVTAAEVLGFYSALVYGQCGSYEETARRIDLDRRTVKARVDEWLRGATGRDGFLN